MSLERLHRTHSPIDAIQVAIDDHLAFNETMAGSNRAMIDWPYIEALKKAHAICNAHDELVTAADAMLAELLFRTEGYRSIPLSAAGRALRAAVAKAKPQP